MTVRTKSAMASQVTTLITDTAGSISGSDVRSVLTDLTDSAYFSEDFDGDELLVTASEKAVIESITAYAETLLDDADAAAARTTLGLGTIATAAAADYVATHAVNAQTGASYALALTDVNDTVTMNNAGANTLTVPANATVAFPVGSKIDIVQLGAGVTTITGASGVTINGVAASSGAISARYKTARLVKLATNTWVCTGDVGTFA